MKIFEVLLEQFWVRAYKGMYPYDPKTTPVTNGRGEVIDDRGGMEPQPITKFNSSNGPFAGFFSDSKEVANQFARIFNSGAVYPVYIQFKNPIIIDARGNYSGAVQFADGARKYNTEPEFERFQSAINDNNNDGVIIQNTRDEGTVYIPRRHSQIRFSLKDNKPRKLGSFPITARGT